MKNWKAELTVRRKCLAKAKIQIGIFQGNALSVLLFVIKISPFSQILRKCTGGTNKLQETINYQMYMDNSKLFSKKWKWLGLPIIGMDVIHLRCRDGIWHRKRCHANKWKRQMTEGTEISRKNQNTRRKENLQVLRNIGSGHHQKIGDERKKEKRASKRKKNI